MYIYAQESNFGKELYLCPPCKLKSFNRVAIQKKLTFLADMTIKAETLVRENVSFLLGKKL